MTTSELEDLVLRFEDCTLPRERWTHLAHLCVALWYLHNLPPQEATRQIRQGIQRYNTSLGNSCGYHETITLSWIALLSGFLRQMGTAQPTAELATAAATRFGSSDYLLRHYSKELLFSDQARNSFVQPDLSPLV